MPKAYCRAGGRCRGGVGQIEKDSKLPRGRGGRLFVDDKQFVGGFWFWHRVFKIGFERFLCNRRGNSAPRTAVFNNHGNGNARIVCRCISDKPGVVFTVGILRGARFARNDNIGQPGAMARAARAVDHVFHYALHGFHDFFRDGYRRGSHLCAFDYVRDG